jgi:hypothetical protein
MQPNSPEQEVDQPYLTALIRKALDRPALQITDWKVQSLHGGLELGSAVFRFQGEARDTKETVPWSLILKTIKSNDKSADPDGIWYWKREALAYQAGILHRLPGGNVTAPTCFEVQERPDGSLWLWMEDVKEDSSSSWTLEHYAEVARHFGQFNGAYLVGEAFPSGTWVTRNWLRMYVENAAKSIAFIRGNLNHPMVQNMFPGIVLAQILTVWDERERILALLDNMPQVFCHQDAFRRNLFTRGGKTIAIDWGYAGIAPVGAELVALVAGSLGFWEVPAEQVKELDRLCFKGYLQGLRDAGWKGDPKLVRIGYAVSLLLRYPIGGQVGDLIPRFLDTEGRSKTAAAFENKSADELEKSDPAIIAYYEGVLPEAFKLLGMTGLLRMVWGIGLNTLRLRARKKV